MMRNTQQLHRADLLILGHGTNVVAARHMPVVIVADNALRLHCISHKIVASMASGLSLQ